MALPLMPKATAVWLVDNTKLSFDQIADFTGLHSLEVSGIADEEVAVGIKGFDPIANSQLTRTEIERCEEDPIARLQLIKLTNAPEQKRKGPRYTPVSKRQDRPAAIAWLVRNHPELADAQISKLVGTTKTTIGAVRERTHWNIANIRPIDPVALGICKQMELDEAVKKAAAKAAKNAPPAGSEEPTDQLKPISETLNEETDRMAKSLSDLADFAAPTDTPAEEPIDADSFFNLPSDK